MEENNSNIFLIPAHNLTVVFTAAILTNPLDKYLYIIDNFIIAAIGNFSPSNPALPGYSMAMFLPSMILGVRLISKKIKKKYILIRNKFFFRRKIYPKLITDHILLMLNSIPNILVIFVSKTNQFHFFSL